MPHRRHIAAFLLALVSIIHIGTARAGVFELQALHFGEWIVAGNNGSQNITVQTDGSYSNSGGVIMLDPPQPGIFRFDTLPISTAINSVIVTQNQPLTLGGGEFYTMTNFTTQYPATTDFAGEVVITIGARANTSGNGNPYDHGTYNGLVDVIINF